MSIQHGVLAVGYGTASAVQCYCNMGVSQVRQSSKGCWLLVTAQPALKWESHRYVNPHKEGLLQGESRLHAVQAFFVLPILKGQCLKIFYFRFFFS